VGVIRMDGLEIVDLLEKEQDEKNQDTKLLMLRYQDSVLRSES
jgi:hypothetical protein